MDVKEYLDEVKEEYDLSEPFSRGVVESLLSEYAKKLKRIDDDLLYELAEKNHIIAKARLLVTFRANTTPSDIWEVVEDLRNTLS